MRKAHAENGTLPAILFLQSEIEASLSQTIKFEQ
jgi:hypothetical protein